MTRINVPSMLNSDLDIEITSPKKNRIINLTNQGSVGKDEEAWAGTGELL
jgi:hypothetical protein